jgi:hypothetical protein
MSALLCQLAEDAACGYLTSISTPPGIHWTSEQKQLIHGVGDLSQLGLGDALTKWFGYGSTMEEDSTVPHQQDSTRCGPRRLAAFWKVEYLYGVLNRLHNVAWAGRCNDGECLIEAST